MFLLSQPLRSSFCLSLFLLILGGCGRAIHPGTSSQAVRSATDSLPTPSSSSIGSQLDATKQTIVQHLAEAIQTAQAQPSPTSADLPVPSTLPDILSPEIGIRWDCGGPAPHFEINNCWSEIINGHYVTVVAGAQEPDLTQGMLWVDVKYGAPP